MQIEKLNSSNLYPESCKSGLEQNLDPEVTVDAKLHYLLFYRQLKQQKVDLLNMKSGQVKRIYQIWCLIMEMHFWCAMLKKENNNNSYLHCSRGWCFIKPLIILQRTRVWYTRSSSQKTSLIKKTFCRLGSIKVVKNHKSPLIYWAWKS